MRNTKKHFRRAIYDMLSGALTVPVYDEKKWVQSTDRAYVIMSTQTEADESPDCHFQTRASIDLEIIVKSGFEGTKDTQDDIEDEILAILRPTQDSDVLTSSGFLIQNLYRERSVTRNISITSPETILQTIVTFTATITEQN